MQKKNKIILILSVSLIVISLITSLFIDNDFITKLTTTITVITAIIGAVAIFVQFKRDKNLNEASFLIDYSNQFYNVYNCGNILNELETARKNPNYSIDVDKYYKDIVGYLEWLESLSALVNSNILQISKIDDVLSYRFFIIVNNKQIQDKEIIPCKEFYVGIYKLYPKWANYKKLTNQNIIFEDNALDKT